MKPSKIAFIITGLVFFVYIAVSYFTPNQLVPYPARQLLMFAFLLLQMFLAHRALKPKQIEAFDIIGFVYAFSIYLGVIGDGDTVGNIAIAVWLATQIALLVLTLVFGLIKE